VDEFSSTFSTSPALVAQGIEHRFPKPGVAGSNPAEGTNPLSCFGRRWTFRGHLIFDSDSADVARASADLNQPSRMASNEVLTDPPCLERTGFFREYVQGAV
jgi:hypothetical protein